MTGVATGPDALAALRFGLSRLVYLPGLVTLFVVFGSLDFVLDLLLGGGSSGALSTGFGYVLQLLVLYGAAIGLRSLDDRSFPERLASGLTRLPGLVPLALVLLLANALVEFVAVGVLPVGGAGTLVAPVVVPLAFARFVLAFPVVANETGNSLSGVRRSYRLTGRFGRETLTFVGVYVLATTLPVLLAVLGTGVVQGTAGRLLVALGTFLGVLVVAPLSVGLARFHRDAVAAA